jgi:hypothetical protein
LKPSARPGADCRAREFRRRRCQIQGPAFDAVLASGSALYAVWAPSLRALSGESDRRCRARMTPATCSSASCGNKVRISRSPVWCRPIPGIAHSFACTRGRSVKTARSRPSWYSICPRRPGDDGPALVVRPNPKAGRGSQRAQLGEGLSLFGGHQSSPFRPSVLRSPPGPVMSRSPPWSPSAWRQCCGTRARRGCRAGRATRGWLPRHRASPPR